MLLLMQNAELRYPQAVKKFLSLQTVLLYYDTVIGGNPEPMSQAYLSYWLVCLLCFFKQ